MSLNVQQQIPSSGIQRVGVLGCGLMGAGIAEVCARAGADVTVVEFSNDAVSMGRKRIIESLDRAVTRGKLGGLERDAALDRLTFATTIESFADRQLVIEAIPEIPDLKLDVFRRIDETVTDSAAILASNTSSIPIMRIAAVTRRPEQVLGMHFFNPVPVLNLVELVSSLRTSETTLERARSFATEQLSKKVIRSTDRAGFVVNALLVPYLLASIRMLEGGHASAEDIDAGMVLGCAHPIGPLGLADMVGLDTTLHVALSLFDEFKESQYAPPPLLVRMVEGGLLGRKSGRGFYDYA